MTAARAVAAAATAARAAAAARADRRNTEQRNLTHASGAAPHGPPLVVVCAGHRRGASGRAFVLTVVTDCAGEDEDVKPFAVKGRSASKATSDVGTARTRAQAEHCCYEGKYQRCPSPVACFGGVDLDACVAKCGGDGRCIANVCTDELRHALAPQGCTSATAPADSSCE